MARWRRFGNDKTLEVPSIDGQSCLMGIRQQYQKWPRAHLMVHPLSYCGIWHDGDPGAARGAVPPSTAPDERMLVRVPVRGGAPDGFFDLGPGLETAALEGQRAQDLPPRFDQVQVSRVLGL